MTTQATAQRSRLLAAVLLTTALVAVYAWTAEWDDSAVNVDAEAAAMPAWALARHGTIDLSQIETANPWVAPGPRGLLSNRPPGTYLIAVPAYLLFGGDDFSTDPATWTAISVTAAAMGVLYYALTRVVEGRVALVAAVSLALGTATWPIASTQLWPHGPGQLAAALAVLGLVRQRYVLTAPSLGAAILIRPPTAVFAAGVGIGELLQKREGRLQRFVLIGTVSALATLGLAIYNQRVYGRFGLSGGYSTSFEERLVSMQWSDYARNLLDMFVLPPNGLLLWTPLIAVGILAAARTWRSTPLWTRAAALSALLYLLVHARMNRASGGLPFNYRYPLEPLVLATPLLSVAIDRWRQSSERRQLLVFAAVAAGFVLQALYTFTLVCEPFDADNVICELGRF